MKNSAPTDLHNNLLKCCILCNWKLAHSSTCCCMSNSVWTVCASAEAGMRCRKYTLPVPAWKIPQSHLEWIMWPICQPFSDQVWYSPDSWLVIAQLIQRDKLSLWLDHNPTDWAHKFITPIVLAGGLERTEHRFFMKLPRYAAQLTWMWSHQPDSHITVQSSVHFQLPTPQLSHSYLHQ